MDEPAELKEYLGFRYTFRNGRFRDSRGRLLILREEEFLALWEHEKSLGNATKKVVVPSDAEMWGSPGAEFDPKNLRRADLIDQGQGAFDAGPERFAKWIRKRIGREPTSEVTAAMESLLRTCQVPTARKVAELVDGVWVEVEQPPEPKGRLRPLLSRAYWVRDIEPLRLLRWLLQKRINARSSDLKRVTLGRSRKRARGAAVDALLEQAKGEAESEQTKDLVGLLEQAGDSLLEQDEGVDDATAIAVLDVAVESVDDEAPDLTSILAAAGLTPAECDVIARRDKGQSYAQIAAERGVSVKTVDSLIQRARKKYRKNLKR